MKTQKAASLPQEQRGCANCSNEFNIHSPPSGQSPCRKIRYNLVNPRYMETCSPPRREAASGCKTFQQFQLARSSQLLAQPPQQSEPQPSFSVSLDIWSNVFGDLVRRTPSLEKVVSLEALVKSSLHGLVTRPSSNGSNANNHLGQNTFQKCYSTGKPQAVQQALQVPGNPRTTS